MIAVCRSSWPIVYRASRIPLSGRRGPTWTGPAFERREPPLSLCVSDAATTLLSDAYRISHTSRGIQPMVSRSVYRTDCPQGEVALVRVEGADLWCATASSACPKCNGLRAGARGQRQRKLGLVKGSKAWCINTRSYPGSVLIILSETPGFGSLVSMRTYSQTGMSDRHGR